MNTETGRPVTVMGPHVPDQVRQAMGISGNVSAELLLLESIRISVWAFSQGGTIQVNGRRITNRAERLIRCLDPDQATCSETAREHLLKLGSIGDIGHCGNDFWLPAPSRILRIGSLQAFVGGLPTFLLPTKFQQLLSHTSPIRVLREAHSPLLAAYALPVQEFDDWSRRTRVTLEERFAEMQQMPLVPVPDSSGTWQSYVVRNWRNEAPWYSHGQRWAELAQAHDGRHVVFHKHPVDNRTRYYVAFLKAGAVLRISPEPISSEEARMLLFAINQHHHFPLKIRITHHCDGSAVLDQRCGLPHSEEKLLIATSQRKQVSDKKYPIHCHIADPKILDEITKQLEQLGVVLEHLQNGAEVTR